MKSLGNISAGAARAGAAMRQQVDQHGEVALFIGDTGELVAVTHYELDYQHVLRTRSRNLVGVYRSEIIHDEPEDISSGIAALVTEDLKHWMGFIRIPARAKVERREAA